MKYLMILFLSVLVPVAIADPNKRDDIPVPTSSILQALTGHFAKVCSENGMVDIEYSNPVSCKSQSIRELKEKCLSQLSSKRPRMIEKIGCEELSSSMKICKSKVVKDYPAIINREGSQQLSRDFIWCLIER
jgi:hypothetical protein